MKGRGPKPRGGEAMNVPNKELLTISWWNGGGGVKKRLEVNPGIREFIK